MEVKLLLGNKSVEVDEELSFEIVFTAFQGMFFELKCSNCLYNSHNFEHFN